MCGLLGGAPAEPDTSAATTTRPVENIARVNSLELSLSDTRCSQSQSIHIMTVTFTLSLWLDVELQYCITTTSLTPCVRHCNFMMLCAVCSGGSSNTACGRNPAHTHTYTHTSDQMCHHSDGWPTVQRCELCWGSRIVQHLRSD